MLVVIFKKIRLLNLIMEDFCIRSAQVEIVLSRGWSPSYSLWYL